MKKVWNERKRKLFEADFVAENARQSGLLEGSLEEAEVVDVEDVSLGGIGGDSVEFDVVDLFADTEGVDGRLLLEAAGLDLEHWWISGSTVGDEEDLEKT